MLRIAWDCLAACSGCETALLDIGEPLLDILAQARIAHMPLLMDGPAGGLSISGQSGIPAADVGVLSGCLRTEADVALAEEMREKCQTLLAVGTCAAFGGVPALANQHALSDMMDTVFPLAQETEVSAPPLAVPRMLDRVRALTEVVRVDMVLPGCPPPPEMLAAGLTSLLDGMPFHLPERSVCDECPTRRERKSLATIQRPLEAVYSRPGQGLGEVRCYMEQGFLCLGPVTMAGCGGADRVPRCIEARVACRGCFGPLRAGADPMLDMLGALASIGLDPRLIEDRAATFRRFTGAGGRLRPLSAAREPTGTAEGGAS